MSRIDYYDGDDEDAVLHMGRWERNTATTIKSKRGQVALKEIRESLLALPVKALQVDTFCEVQEDGPPLVCVLGAYALYKGLEPEKLRGFNEERVHEMAYWASGTNTLNLTYTLAWNLMDKNDEEFSACTPEERYQKFMEWLNDNIRSG